MLKQSAHYFSEAKKLKYLYTYLMNWSKKTDKEYNIEKQIIDYLLSTAIIRLGGYILPDDYSTFDPCYYNHNVAIYSAGTFGQQLVKHFNENKHCSISTWVDDDYWEYRRCCLNVDPVEEVNNKNFDYILIAKLDDREVNAITQRLRDLNVPSEKILSVRVPEKKEVLLQHFLDVEAIEADEQDKRKDAYSHA